MSYRLTALMGCAAACALVAGPASAQFLSLEVTAGHRAFAPGMPQNVQFRPTPTAPFTPVTLFSVIDTATTKTLNPPTTYSLFVQPGVDAPSAGFLAANPNLRLIDGSAATNSSFKIELSGAERIPDIDRGAIDDFKYFGRCFTVGSDNPAERRLFLPLVPVQPCSALSVTGAMDGVAFSVTSAEDSNLLRIQIPSIGFDFTSVNSLIAPVFPVTRGDGVSQAVDNLFATGRDKALAARLLGVSEGALPARGALPDDGDLIRGSITVGGVTKTFGVRSPGHLLAYMVINHEMEIEDFGLSYSGECHRLVRGGPIVGACTAASGTLSALGLQVEIDAPANSTDISFRVRELDLEYTSTGQLSREDAIGDFAEYAEENADRRKLTAAYARYLAATDPRDPLIGNPASAQGQLTRAALDLDSPSAALGETDGKSGKDGARGRDLDPSGWMIGGRTGYLSSGGSEATFVDANLERGFRIREGSRMRFKLSLPASYIRYQSTRGAGGSDTATLGVRAALEAPLIRDRWVIEPSASASAFYASNYISSGALYLVGLSSRYKLDGIGRGHIVIGNAVTYSSTLNIEAGDFATPKIRNTSVRNGVAYQVPYGRFLGRQGTVRASYTYTHIFGDQVLVDDYHQVSLNYGVAGREAAVKQIGETLRFGLNGAFGRDFTAVSLTAGYRF